MCSRQRLHTMATVLTTAAALLLSSAPSAAASSSSTAAHTILLASRHHRPATATAAFVLHHHHHHQFSSSSSSFSRKDHLLRRHAYAKGRPSLDDVERLSHGQAAKKRGTGSRNICHRLNEMERKEFDLAKKMGFVQLRGTGYRRERKGSPLANIHRQLCDALGRACIEVHRGLGTDATDEVIVDLSPFRPVEAAELALALEVCVEVEKEFLPPLPPAGDGAVNAAGGGGGAEEGTKTETEGENENLLAKWHETHMSFAEEDWQKKPVWELPVLSYIYDCTGRDRNLAKKVAQEVHARLSKLPRKR